MPGDILIIEDDLSIRQVLGSLLKVQKYHFRSASTGEEGLAMCEQELPSLVLLDLVLPGIDGMAVLSRIKEMNRACHVVVMTAYASATSAVEAIRLGADEYLTKPVAVPELLGLIAKLIGGPDDRPLLQGMGLDKIVGESKAIRKVFELVHRVSRTFATVMITGESGTGKEAIARAIHVNSQQENEPFVSLNCASIPSNLLEAELFGYERGAFTDAKGRKQGLIEVAGQGTLFLDEVGLLPLDLQGKILGVLETRKFRRVGATGELSASARFITATNMDLEEAVEAGGFREDLYYRLNVIPLQLPALRERGQDILRLARHFLEEYSRRHGVPFRTLSNEAQQLLLVHSWPGNVRELRNEMERVVLLTDNTEIEASDLSIDRRSSGQRQTRAVEVSEAGLIEVSFPPWGISLEDLERRVIEEALAHTEGNISQAARLLHVSRYALRYRMQKHEIGVPVNGQSKELAAV